jgi:GNAT superfamily N-acetyltransferase
LGRAPAKVVISRAAGLSHDQRDQTAALMRVVFPPEQADGLVFADDDWHVMVEIDGSIVSRLGIVDREVEVGGALVRVAGVGGVGTLPQWRGRGLARLALERVAGCTRDDLGADFGLLICGDAMSGFYARSGWTRISSPIWYDQPSGRRLLGGVAMVLSARRSVWPAGTVYLRGLPF